MCWLSLQYTDGAQETDITLGAGGKTLTVKTYTMTVGNLTVNAQVTENGCIPVSESIVGRSPGGKIKSSSKKDRELYLT